MATSNVINLNAFITLNNTTARRIAVDGYTYNVYFNDFGRIVGVDEWMYDIPTFDKLAEVLAPNVTIGSLKDYEIADALEDCKVQGDVRYSSDRYFFLTREELFNSNQYKALLPSVWAYELNLLKEAENLKSQIESDWYYMDQKYSTFCGNRAFIGSPAEESILVSLRHLDEDFDKVKTEIAFLEKVMENNSCAIR